MIVVTDSDYNEKYPRRPKRYILSDDGGVGPIYFTADVILTSIARAQADLDKWNEIQNTVSIM